MIKALVIDDSPLVRRIVRLHLAKFGCTVVREAESAAQALRVFEEIAPNLITLDIMMPALEGVTTMRAFQAMLAAKPDLVAVVVSSVPFYKVRDTYLKAGAFAYIVKPLTQRSLEPVRQELLRLFGQPDRGLARTD